MAMLLPRWSCSRPCRERGLSVEMVAMKFQVQPAPRTVLTSDALQAKHENSEIIDPMHPTVGLRFIIAFASM